jgi:hypothetical protein
MFLLPSVDVSQLPLDDLVQARPNKQRRRKVGQGTRQPQRISRIFPRKWWQHSRRAGGGVGPGRCGWQAGAGRRAAPPAGSRTRSVMGPAKRVGGFEKQLKEEGVYRFGFGVIDYFMAERLTVDRVKTPLDRALPRENDLVFESYTVQKL